MRLEKTSYSERVGSFSLSFQTKDLIAHSRASDIPDKVSKVLDLAAHTLKKLFEEEAERNPKTS